jgi:hypothetical protein
VTDSRLFEAQTLLEEGNALRQAGRLAEAIGAYRRVAAALPDHCAGHHNLGVALAESREWREAVLCLSLAARLAIASGLHNIYDVSVQRAIDILAASVERGGPALFAPPTGSAAVAEPQPISFVVCSIRPDLLEAMQRNFREALGEREHEFVVIGDARSLSEGYMRGLERSRHGIVVFCHDDVEILSPRPFEALDRALAANDVAGLCGATRVRGPAVMWAGHPYLRGFVAMPIEGEAAALHATLFGLDCGVMGGMQALDGFLFAARREAALATGFDAVTFDGFHFYDLDFTYRAYLSGLRVAVTTDIVAVHKSGGDFGADWQRYAQRFSGKFASLDGVRGPNHHFAVRLASRGNVLRFYEEIRGLAAAA